jgi:AraC family transcriptional regulator
VLRRLSPMRVASFRAVGETPERDAQNALFQWAQARGLMSGGRPYRVFGFDNPSPSPGNHVYGYEFWMTIGPEIGETAGVPIKQFPGGFYAVTGTTVAEIGDAWKHFVRWLKISKYKSGSHRCLEEHLSPLDVPEDKMQIDLYLPLVEP